MRNDARYTCAGHVQLGLSTVIHKCGHLNWGAEQKYMFHLCGTPCICMCKHFVVYIYVHIYVEFHILSWDLLIVKPGQLLCLFFSNFLFWLTAQEDLLYQCANFSTFLVAFVPYTEICGFRYWNNFLIQVKFITYIFQMWFTARRHQGQLK